MDKRELSHTVGGNVILYINYRKPNLQFIKKNQQQNYHVIWQLLRGRDICTPTLTVAQFMLAKK
jgi:hypothetical protein